MLAKTKIDQHLAALTIGGVLRLAAGPPSTEREARAPIHQKVGLRVITVVSESVKTGWTPNEVRSAAMGATSSRSYTTSTPRMSGEAVLLTRSQAGHLVTMGLKSSLLTPSPGSTSGPLSGPV